MLRPALRSEINATRDALAKLRMAVMSIQASSPAQEMFAEHLLSLGQLLCRHTDRGLYTLAARVGVHSRFFTNIEAGGGCRIEAYSRVLTWFDTHWPADLEWPAGIDRPSARSSRKRRAA